MKRVFEEISDDEWEDHDFNLSRILKREKSPPSIESFAYQPAPRQNFDRNGGNFIQIQEDLEDEDAAEVTEVPPPGNRARRFVVEDSDEDLPEVFEIRSDEDDLETAVGVDELEDDVDEEDVVGKALQKCARISASLRKELYGSSAPSCDRYAEVEASSARIVTQACGLIRVFAFIFMKHPPWAASDLNCSILTDFNDIYNGTC